MEHSLALRILQTDKYFTRCLAVRIVAQPDRPAAQETFYWDNLAADLHMDRTLSRMMCSAPKGFKASAVPGVLLVLLVLLQVIRGGRTKNPLNGQTYPTCL